MPTLPHKIYAITWEKSVNIALVKTQKIKQNEGKKTQLISKSIDGKLHKTQKSSDA